eukprot:TRINITY_DN199_c3_g1_i2.p2 TRINITY_DN199_c3_g1~~TRINITY_DN199_c3_g1_i2.p2  ORF type:complete len:191 (-),score=83.22 TRINITY_DN199_c3_g1_i2:666-1238(-)
MALLASWLEYAVEAALAPSLKSNSTVICVGLGLVALGQALRVIAMWTCGRNFNHLIMAERDAGHELVTRGVYAVLRHPSYCGWFWWSVGTQVLLGNPLCLAGYTWAGWAFFSERIPYEERLLSQFYPHEYPAYAARTYVGIPFISNTKLRAAAAAAAAAAAPAAALNGSSGGGGAATNGAAANGDSRKQR